MKKTLISGLVLLLALSACNSFIPTVKNTSENNITFSELNEENMGMVSLSINKNPFFERGFDIKGVDFTNTAIKKLKLEIKGNGITDNVSQTIDWTAGTKASFSLSVLAGKNRILILSALDINGNNLSSLMGVTDVVAGTSNVASISYFQTIIAQTLLNILNSTNSTLLNTFSFESLKTYFTNVTGYDKANNTFTKIDPAFVNTTLVANYLATNNGSLPAENAEGLESTGNLKVTLNQTGAKLLLNDLSSASVDSTTTNDTTINNATSGEWLLTVMKDGYVTQSVKVIVVPGTTVNTSLNLVAAGPVL